MTKILVIRFSSIGDIVLTSPVIRCLKEQINNVEVHALTKKQYASLYTPNPHITKVHEWGEDNKAILENLKQLDFDYVIDLHHNIRTQKIKSALKKKSYSFPKLNVQKWLYVNFKYNKMPDVHIVDRYFEAVKELGVKNDQNGLDFFLAKEDEVDVSGFSSDGKYISMAIGAQFATKKLPVSKIIEILETIELPVVIIGGKEDVKEGEEICNALSHKKIINACGEYSIQGSASIIRQSQLLITHDTGMMHVATAYDLPIISIWGNTVPEFGMYPYRPQAQDSYAIHQVEGLSCRPCSKIGYQKCPKKHFRCMMDQDIEQIQTDIKRFTSQ